MNPVYWAGWLTSQDLTLLLKSVHKLLKWNYKNKAFLISVKELTIPITEAIWLNFQTLAQLPSSYELSFELFDNYVRMAHNQPATLSFPTFPEIVG